MILSKLHRWGESLSGGHSLGGGPMFNNNFNGFKTSSDKKLMNYYFV